MKMADLNYIHVMGFETESDLDADKPEHIDSISQTGDWEDDVASIIADHKDNYFHITVESDDGKPLPSFCQ